MLCSQLFNFGLESTTHPYCLHPIYSDLIDISLLPTLNVLFGPPDRFAPSLAASSITLCPSYHPSVACIASKLLLAKLTQDVIAENSLCIWCFSLYKASIQNQSDHLLPVEYGSSSL